MINNSQLIYICILAVTFWFVIGIGVARMVMDIKKCKFSLSCIFIWPIIVMIYAYAGDVEE